MALGVALSLGLILRGWLLPRISPLFSAQAPLEFQYVWLFVLAFVVFTYERLYTKRRTAWEELRHILRGTVVTYVVFLALMTIIKEGANVSRPAIFISFIAAPFILIGFRLWVKSFLQKGSFWFRQVLVVGCNSEAIHLAYQIDSFSELGLKIVGFLCEGDEEPGNKWAKLGDLSELENVLGKVQVDEIIIALPKGSRLKQFEILTRAEALVSKVSVLPELFDADKLNIEVDKVNRYFLLSFHNNLMKPTNRFVKNVFEILSLLLAIPIWLPLMIALALAVKLSSPGPALFRQTRVGRAGKEFSCLKFRTMGVDAEDQLIRFLQDNPQAREEWESERKLKNDPRITAVGHFLRKTSLDELPQIINILKGEMSLIGPRPIVSEEVEMYSENFKYYTSVCPGLSGLWQVSGRNDIDYRQRVMLDIFYVRNWSLWLDFMILLRTVPIVLRKDGAY